MGLRGLVEWWFGFRCSFPFVPFVSFLDDIMIPSLAISFLRLDATVISILN